MILSISGSVAHGETVPVVIRGYCPGSWPRRYSLRPEGGHHSEPKDEGGHPEPALRSFLLSSSFEALAFAFSRSVLEICDVYELAEHRNRPILLPQPVTKCTVPGSPTPRGEGGHPCQLDHFHIPPLLDHQGTSTRPLADRGDVHVREFGGGRDRHRGVADERVSSVVGHEATVGWTTELPHQPVGVRALGRRPKNA
jgi:hypothetical protein